MNRLNLYLSNRVEILAEELARALAKPAADPFAPQVVVVPNQGTARWLAQGLAGALGVCANVRFPFPDQFLLDAARAVVGELPDPAPFSLGVLPWRVLGALPAVAAGPGGKPLGAHLADPSGAEAAERKAIQLATQLAGTFELYTVFRPDLLRSWEAGAEPGQWQAELWRALTRDCPGAHRATALERLITSTGVACPRDLPERVHVFGVGVLAPLRLEAFAALARHVEVNLYLGNPSFHFWSDLRSAREQARAARVGGAATPAPVEADLPAEVGNPLLASLGRQGRAFFDALAALPAAAAPDHLFADPGEGSLLECLQSDILHLRHRGVDGTPVRELAAGDRSVVFHVCHSPLREVEALRDWLLGVFDDHPGLEPRDVLVATPDPETYAPFVAAVFDGAGEEACRIPYALADRGVRAANPLADGFLRLLAVAGGRFGAQEVLDLLELPALARRFGFAGEDRVQVARWVEQTRVRWGIDAAHRERCGVPSFGDNSWRAGLERLLVGYALPGDGESLWKGVLPHGEVEGDGARVLGCLVDWAEALFALDAELASPRPPEAWAQTLEGVLERFFAPNDDEAGALLSVRRTLRKLAEYAVAAEFSEPLSLTAVRDHLEAALEGDPAGGGTFSGRVTVASLRTLRGLPFRVVALLGMNDGVFPRADRPPTFDRIAAAPRPGDPSLRDEDRYLFLEALLAARERLLVSYLGRSAKDSAELPPSVVVSELLDAIAEGFHHPAGELPGPLVTVHRLQAFHPAYFRPGSGLASTSAEDLAGARALAGPPTAPRPLAPEPLPEPEEPWREVDLDTLMRFYRHPARFFLQRRLGVRRVRGEGGAQEREPFALDALERYGVLQDLGERLLAGDAAGAALPVLRARGELPPGRPGEVVFENLAADASAFAERVRGARGSEPLPPLTLDLTLGPFRLRGRLDGLYPTARVCHRPVRGIGDSGKDLVAAWLEHLALALARGPEHPERTVLVGRDGAVALDPVADPAPHLTTLLELYGDGLRRPLPLLPGASLAYAKALADGKDEDTARDAARRKWEGTEYQSADRDDTDLQTCFRRVDPLDEPFRAVARAVYGPLLAHRGKV